jgi:hypothetical protein
MAKYKGTARALAFASALGDYKLISDTLFNNGYTTRARTKQYGDSIAALKLNISDTTSMLSNYRRTSTRIENADLRFSTISGVSLGASLFSLSTGYGLNGSLYDGGAIRTWEVDTNAISTKANVTGAMAAKLNISDTAAMLSGLSLDRVLANGNTSGRDISVAKGTFASSGDGTPTVDITHSSGSGIALNITKGGNDEGLYVNKTSGSGNAATIIGTLNATALVKSGGTSSQFLMADGSVNTSVLPSGAYLPLSGGTLTGALNGTSAAFSSHVTLNNGQYYRAKRADGAEINVLGFPSASNDLTMVTAGDFFIRNTGATSLFSVSSAGQVAATSAAFSGAVTSQQSNITADGAGVVLQGYVDNNLRIAVRGSGYNDGARGGLLVGAVDGTSAAFSGAGSFGGNVGIGTTTPNIISGSGIDINSATAGTVSSLNISTGGTRRGSLYADNSSLELKTATAIPLTLGVNGSDDIRISAGNRVLIKTTTDNGTDALQVAGSGLFTGTINANSGGGNIRLAGTTDGGIWMAGSILRLADWATGTKKLDIDITTGAATFSSTVSATGFIVSSDRRLKNIVSRSGDMVTYTLKNDNTKQLHYGYIAQEVEKVLPTTVSTDDKGMKAVNYIEVLVKKVNDLEKKIEQLEKLLNK